MTSILPLELEQVCFDAGGRTLLDRVSVRFDSRGRSFILGPNGAGKSLLLRIAHGLLPPSAGRVVWSGGDAISCARNQAMVFERPVLLRRSVIANVEYALARRGFERSSVKRKAEAALERTGLQDFAQRNARVLSSGEQQRLALARAWAVDPQVLFLDEPTAALDPSATRSVEQIIEAISDGGTKIIMITHDMAQARRLADEVLFFNRGALVERAATNEFFDSPKSSEARAFARGELLW
ncbi:MAG: ATP-binding cassette domain-containing protein [Deltaproteobacteria bacterium]|nr:ATP-binding cassette domain-containing protein [Deltaproteobacteria bacterium]